MLVSGVEQSNSGLCIYKTHVCTPHVQIHTCVSIHVIFHYRLLQDTEYSSLCCAIGLCCLFVLCAVACIC